MYQAEGATLGEKLSSGGKVARVAAIVAMIAVSALIIPFLFEHFRNALFFRIEELVANHKIDLYYKRFDDEDI
ncbi:MAG: hypothetical protein ACSNEK_00165 [Parachlamydiaceae bacterium]